MWRNSICFDWRRSHDSISLSSFSRKLAVASWSYSCFSQGRRQVRVQHSDFSLEPPLTSRGILERCWKQMVTGSNPARSLGNLHQNLIKIQSCFQAHMNLSFRSTPPWASNSLFFYGYTGYRGVDWSKGWVFLTDLDSEFAPLRRISPPAAIQSPARSRFTHWHLAKVPMIGPVGMMQKRLRIDQILIRF